MTAETLGELLAQHNLRPRHSRNGSSHRLKCPDCNAKDEDSFSLKIDDDGRGFTGHCHRGSCGFTDGAVLKAVQAGQYPGGPTTPKNIYRAPQPHLKGQDEASFGCYAWFEARGINSDTVDWFGCYEIDHRFFDQKVHSAVVWPYKFKGALVNRKYRAMETKGLMGQDPKPMPTLYNIDAVESDDEIIFVEGECDVMALYQSGFRQVVSLKDGAPAKAKEEDDPTRESDKRFEALNTHQEQLQRIKKFILAGDMDAPGEVLRLELGRRLGRHRCFVARWPEGCKDANDCLKQFGPEMVQSVIEGAQPYPLEGVQQISDMQIADYMLLPPPAVMSSGISSVDAAVRFPTEGRIIVVTGIPNMGKSKFVMNVMVNTMKINDRKWCAFTPEQLPVDELLVEMAQIFIGKRRIGSRDGYSHVMSREEAIAAAKFFKTRLFPVADPPNGKAPSLDWLLETCAQCVLARGATDFLIDPWNEIKIVHGSSNETDWVGECLQKMRLFSMHYGCNVWIVAHPQKQYAAKPGDEIKAPGPYDIAGSAHWYNKADVGITIHTPNNVTGLNLWKSRHVRWGRKNTSAIMEFDSDTGRYYSPEAPGSQSRCQESRLAAD